jgi:hypothetical protein
MRHLPTNNCQSILLHDDNFKVARQSKKKRDITKVMSQKMLDRKVVEIED